MWKNPTDQYDSEKRSEIHSIPVQSDSQKRLELEKYMIFLDKIDSHLTMMLDIMAMEYPSDELNSLLKI